MFSYMEVDDPTFNLDLILIGFIESCPFFAALSRRIKKVCTRTISTMGVTYDSRTDDIALLWNPEFAASLTRAELVGVLKHEFYHLVFNHVTVRRRKPHEAWNIATDLAINSIITKSKDAFCDLPKCVPVPGVVPETAATDSPRTEEELARIEKFGKLIASLPPMMPSEWYFQKLLEEMPELSESGKCQKCGAPMPGSSSSEGDSDGESDQDSSSDGSGTSEANGDEQSSSCGKAKGKNVCGKCGHDHGSSGVPGRGHSGQFDHHDGWDDIDPDDRERIENKVRSMVEQAAKHAQSSSNGWGDMPVEIQEDIKRSVSNIIPWRAVLKQFIGSLLPGARATSIKKINRKYPYIHPGLKRGRIAKLLVAMDQSGSVGNDAIELFFAELASLTKKIEIDIVSFDTVANREDIVRWKKGTPLPPFRERCGGTNFDAPTKLANDQQNRGRWDGILIMTDGLAPAPIDCRIKRGWVLAPETKLNFQSSELQVFIDKNKPMEGCYR
jgi:predicted metal-dependent peptidase